MPELKRVYGSYKDQGLILIGVHCDKDVSERDKSVATNKLVYPICEDKGDATQKMFGVDGYPTVYVIDRAGVIRAVDPEDLEQAVKDAIKASK